MNFTFHIRLSLKFPFPLANSLNRAPVLMQMSCSGNYKQYAERPPHGRPDPPENCLITPFKRKSVKTLSLSVLERAREAPSELIRTYIIVFNFFSGGKCHANFRDRKLSG